MRHYTNTDNPVDFPQTVSEIDAFIAEHSGEEYENLEKSMVDPDLGAATLTEFGSELT